MLNFSSLALKLREDFEVTVGPHFSLLLPYIPHIIRWKINLNTDLIGWVLLLLEVEGLVISRLFHLTLDAVSRLEVVEVVDCFLNAWTTAFYWLALKTCYSYQSHFVPHLVVGLSSGYV